MPGVSLAAEDLNDPSAQQFDDRTLSAAESFVEVASNLREHDYANLHFVNVEQTTTRAEAGKPHRVVTRYECWSRENQYFRVDSKVLESTNPRVQVGERIRLVVQPKGYVHLRARADGEPYTIRNWGDTQTGLSRIFGNRYLCAATRFRTILDADVIVNGFLGEPLDLQRDIGAFSREVAKEAAWLSATLSNENSLIALKYRHGYDISSNDARFSHSDPNSNKVLTDAVLVCDVKRGVVLRYEGKNYDGNGELSFTVGERKEYDFERFGPYPSQIVENVTMIKHPSSVSRQTELQLVEWNTVTPLGVFSLEAQGFKSVDHEEVWGRRLLIALIGAGLFFVTVAIKRRRNAYN
jgi:hypothetical protein